MVKWGGAWWLLPSFFACIFYNICQPLGMMNTTSKNVHYASYDVMSEGRRLAQVTFPSDTLNANFYDVCFYDPATDTFRGDTVVGQYTLKRVV
jgi:hypothetical protein